MKSRKSDRSQEAAAHILTQAARSCSRMAQELILIELEKAFVWTATTQLKQTQWDGHD